MEDAINAAGIGKWQAYLVRIVREVIHQSWSLQFLDLISRFVVIGMSGSGSTVSLLTFFCSCDGRIEDTHRRLSSLCLLGDGVVVMEEFLSCTQCLVSVPECASLLRISVRQPGPGPWLRTVVGQELLEPVE